MAPGNDQRDGEKNNVHKTWTEHILHFGNLVTRRLFWCEYDLSPGSFVQHKRQAIPLVETILLDRFEGLSVAHNFAGGQVMLLVRSFTTDRTLRFEQPERLGFRVVT